MEFPLKIFHGILRVVLHGITMEYDGSLWSFICFRPSGIAVENVSAETSYCAVTVSLHIDLLFLLWSDNALVGLCVCCS